MVELQRKWKAGRVNLFVTADSDDRKQRGEEEEKWSEAADCGAG